jgi:hypothetical protein
VIVRNIFWLRLTMLAPLAGALYVVDNEMKIAAWRLAEGSVAGGLPFLGLVLGLFLGPLVTALLFAYPTTRLYARYSVAASALLCLPIVLDSIFVRIGFDPFLKFVLIVQVLGLCISLAAIAWLANREMADSRLVIVDRVPSQPDSSNPAAPRWLSLVLIPMLALGFFLIDDLVQRVVWDIGFMGHSQAFDRAGLLVGAIIAPALLAMAFAYPLARLYGRRAAVVAMLISAPTISHRVLGYLEDVHTPFVVAAFTIQPLALTVLVPLAAWKTNRKLGSSRLAIISGEIGDEKPGEASLLPGAQPVAISSN